MLYTACFVNAGVPATGLSPTIRIRNAVSGALIITDAAMYEIGDGAYGYDHAGYDETLSYSVRVDGTVTLPNADRYLFAFMPAVVASAGESTQRTRIQEIWQLHGLDATKALIVNSAVPTGARQVGSGSPPIQQLIETSGTTQTVTRI